jgi:hypothetical protein
VPEPAAAHTFAAKLSAVSGLVWRHGCKTVENPTGEAAGDPPDPYLPEYMERVAGRMVYQETSRGCPFSCGFCLSGRGEGVRFFDTGQTKHNLVKLANSGAGTVKLVDRTFNSHPRRCRELIGFMLACREAGSIPATVRFHLEAAADLFDRETIHMLAGAPAGLFQIEIGVQSFHQETLTAIGRSTDMDRVKENFRLLREGNHIRLHLDLIAGLPYEGYEAFGQSFDQAFSLSPHILQLGFLKLLHGSLLREQSGRYGIASEPNPPYRVRSTDWISIGELADLELCEDALERVYNSGRFPATWRYLLAASKMTPFQMFSALGRFTGKSTGKPLETYIMEIIRFGKALPDVDQEVLRDQLVMDWLQTNHVGVLPVCLQKVDPLNRKVEQALRRLQNDEAIPPELGVRRPYGFGLLYGSGKTRVALANYRQRRPYLGEYPLQVIDVEKLILL